MNKKLKKIVGDGNCLFRSLSFGLYGYQRNYKKIREEIVLHVIRNWAHFEPSIVTDPSYSEPVESYQQYANYMGCDGVFGGEVELVAFLEIHPDYCIHVYYPESAKPHMYGSGDKYIYLQYSGELDKGHYDILIPPHSNTSTVSSNSARRCKGNAPIEKLPPAAPELRPPCKRNAPIEDGNPSTNKTRPKRKCNMPVECVLSSTPKPRLKENAPLPSAASEPRPPCKRTAPIEDGTTPTNIPRPKRKCNMPVEGVLASSSKPRLRGNASIRRIESTIPLTVAPLLERVHDDKEDLIPGKKIEKDQSSLFRCFAVHLYGNQKRHLGVRKTIVLHVINNWPDFESTILKDPFYDTHIKNKQEYAASMSSKNVFGGEAELRAFVNINTDVCIFVFKDTSKRPKIYCKSRSTVTSYIYLEENHRLYYNILIPNPNTNHRPNTKKEVLHLGDVRNTTKIDILDVGDLNIKCQYCGGLSFKNESGRVANNCCHHGKVKLPPLNPYPDYFKELLLGNTKDSIEFRSHIRSYNSAFSFACFQANFCDFQHQWAPILKIHGQVYHMGTASLQTTNSPRNGQIYIYDGEIAQKLRSNCGNTNLTLLKKIETVLRKVNPYAKHYQTLNEKYNECNTNQELSLNFVRFNCDDKRLYNAPLTGEIAAIIVSKDGVIPSNIDFRVFPRHSRDYEVVPKTSQHLDPMTFPIFFPSGDLGWNYSMKQIENDKLTSKKISPVQYYGYRLAMRGNFNPLMYGGRLTQQYVIHAYIIIESQRLNFLRFNQGQLRRECYQGLVDHIHRSKANSSDHIRLGTLVILPPTYIGSPRCMQQLYLDAMAMSRKIGRPDLFITMTCNPDWPEFKRILKDYPKGYTINDLPFIVCRVFHMKLMEMINEIFIGKVFGPVVGYVYTIEFQKRGLPHAHLLFILRTDSKLLTPEEIDKYISAEIPDSKKNKALYILVIRHMLHGPHSSSTPCWNEENKICSKGFPKEFSTSTDMKGEGYPKYKRSDNRSSLHKYNAPVDGKRVLVDNRMTVPYNPYLLQKYNCHINTEYCASVMSVKYIHKYIHKGHDRARISIDPEKSKTDGKANAKTDEPDDVDEIKSFIDSRYVSPIEAAWRILELPLHGRSHSVVRLPVHLDGQQQITFEEGNEIDAINKENAAVTPLLGWFALNGYDAGARVILYTDIPLHYRWDTTKRQWIKRKNVINVVTRIVGVSPKDVERFHLKLILTKVPGATSYNSLKTVNGVLYKSFRETAVVMGLTVNSDEAIEVMKEAAEIMMPSQLRKFFVWYIVGEMPPDAISLWESFKNRLSEDFQNCADPETKALLEIEKLFNFEGLSGTTFGLPYVDASMIQDDFGIIDNTKEHKNICDDLVPQLNEDQLKIYDVITDNIKTDSLSRCYFIDGPGGTGKTFLYQALYHFLKSENIKVATVAWTGIASILLPGGTTSHKMFNLPINLNDDHISQLQKRDKERLHAVDVIIWDEASMIPRMALETVDRTLRDLMNTDVPFGGKFFILGGDFRQVLPVVKRGSKYQIIGETIKNSYLWPSFEILKLTKNMRANQDSEEFSKWLLDIGNGVVETLEVPKSLQSDNLVEEMYSNVSENELATQAILAPQNLEVNRINEKILNLLPEKTQYSYSIDKATLPGIDKTEKADEEATLRYPIEYLNSLTPSGLPPHKLALKVGAIVMLIRNLSVADGLCNGTRLIVREIRQRIITTQIMTGAKSGEIAQIPRIELNTADDKELPFVLYRRQFPIRLAYAMTINKAQGQTFDRVGIYIDRPLFGHGQLYVALSRCRTKQGIKIMSKGTCIRNIVYKEVL